MSAQIPPLSWYRNPELDALTPLTVTSDGRVVGHVAGWETAHVSFPGKRITPPRSRTDYGYFMTGAMEVQDGEGAREISVGRLIMGCPHAGTSLAQQDAHDFYADSGAVAATVCAYEDRFGIAIAGSVEPGLDELALRRFRACGLSGDWRSVNGNLELVGVISVGVQGFPIPRSRVASGAPMALVAAGALAPAPMAFARRVDPSWSGHGSTQVDVVTSADFASLAASDALADRILDRLEHRRVTAEHAALVTELDDTPALVASILSEVDDTEEVVASLLAEMDDTPQRAAALLASLDEGVPADLSDLDADDVEALGRLDRSPRKNWVEEQGGLPDYIDRIAVHLTEKGMSTSHAIATAINAAKKMCATGDLNFPGSQQVNPGSRAQACSAVAHWETMKKAARGS